MWLAASARSTRVSIALASICLSTACQDPAAVSWPVPISRVQLSPSAVQVQPGTDARLSAVATDAAGRELASGAMTWTSSDDRIAVVSADGWVTGVTPGSATIRAIRDGVVGEARVVVAWTPVARIDVAPSRVDVRWYGRERVAAVLYDARGNKLPPRPVSWSASPSWLLVIDGNGYMVGVAEGTGTITARIDQAVGTATYTVVSPCSSGRLAPANPTFVLGAIYQLNATFSDRTANVIVPPAVVWTSSNTSVAEVGQDGLAYPRAVGVTTVTASCGRIAAATVVRISR